jgi:hypothetical protein
MIAVEFMDISQGSGPRSPAKGSATHLARSDAATVFMATAEEHSRAHCCAVRQATSSPISQMSLAAISFVRQVSTDDVLAR